MENYNVYGYKKIEGKDLRDFFISIADLGISIDQFCLSCFDSKSEFSQLVFEARGIVVGMGLRCMYWMENDLKGISDVTLREFDRKFYDVKQLLDEVHEHKEQLDKVRLDLNTCRDRIRTILLVLEDGHIQ